MVPQVTDGDSRSPQVTAIHRLEEQKKCRAVKVLAILQCPNPRETPARSTHGLQLSKMLMPSVWPAPLLPSHSLQVLRDAFFPPSPLIPSSLSYSRQRSIPRQLSSSAQSILFKQHVDISSSSSFTNHCYDAVTRLYPY